MGIVVRQSIYNSLASYLGVIIGAINTIVLFPNIFTADEFGLTRVIGAAATLFSSFSLFATPNSTIKFFPFFKDKAKKHNGFLFYSLSIPLIGYVIFVILSYLFKGNIIDHYSGKSTLFSDYFNYIPLLVFYIMYFKVFDAYLRGVLKTVIQSFLNNVVLRFSWTILIVLYYYDILSFEQFIFYYFNMYALILLILVVYTAYLKQLFLLPNFKMFTKERLKEMLTYALFVILGSSSAMLAGTIDSLMIGALVEDGLSNVAFYSVALYIGTVIIIPYQSLSRIANSIISDAWKKNDTKEIEHIYKQSSLNLLIVGSLIFLGIWLNADNIFQILPKEYGSAKYVLLFVCLAKLYDVSTGVNSSIIQFSPFYKLMLYFNLLLMGLLIATNYWLIPIMGIEGAALATLLSIFTTNTLRLFIIKVKMNVLPFDSRSLLVIVVGGITFLVGYFIPKLEWFLADIIVRSLTVSILFMVPIYLLKISKEFNGIIDKVLKLAKLKK